MILLIYKQHVYVIYISDNSNSLHLLICPLISDFLLMNYSCNKIKLTWYIWHASRILKYWWWSIIMLSMMIKYHDQISSTTALNVFCQVCFVISHSSPETLCFFKVSLKYQYLPKLREVAVNFFTYLLFRCKVLTWCRWVYGVLRCLNLAWFQRYMIEKI